MSEKIKEMRFVLESTEHDETIFRFYPKDSHCHSFGDEPPTNWGGVYKVYYAWDIVKFEKWRGQIINCESKVLFDMPFDECSPLTELPGYLFGIVDIGDSVTHVLGQGMPSSNWDIKVEDPKVEFTVWHFPDSNGYRFRLYKEKAKEFADFLKTVNEYMLEHGEPI